MNTPITTPREITLENVDNVDRLKEYLNQFVDCYDKKLTMFLKVRSMILALNEKIPDYDKYFKENSIRVTELLNNNIDKNLKQNYLKKNQDPPLLSETTNINIYIQNLMKRFCNKGLDLSNFPVYEKQFPKPMFQTLLLEIMSDNYATKKLIEKEMKLTNDSPATTIGDSPSKFYSSVGTASSTGTDSSADTEVMNYMMSPMSPVKRTLFSTISELSNTKSLSPLKRDDYIKGEINNLNNNDNNYHKVHSASKFWELFRDHYNENCKKLHGDFKINTKPFGDNNTFYNQKMRNMQIIWKHVMQLKKRRQELYVLLKQNDGNVVENDNVATPTKQLPKNISHFEGETIEEAKPFEIFTEDKKLNPDPNPETLTKFMKEMSNAISEPNFQAAENIEVETFMEIPEPPKDVPEPPKDVPEPPKDVPEPPPLPPQNDIVIGILEILEKTIPNKNEPDPDTYFQKIRKQHYLAMEILLNYKKTNKDIDNKFLAETLEKVDDAIYFVPQINVGGQETQDVYYYKNVEIYGIFDKENVAEEFLKSKEVESTEQPTEQLTEPQIQEKILELLDWMAINIHVFVGNYNLLRGNLEVIFEYIKNNHLKIFNTRGTYEDNTNEKLIVDYLKVFIEAIKANDNNEFGTLKSNVITHDVDITEKNGNIVIQEKLLDIDGSLKKINSNIDNICEEVEVEVTKNGRKIKETRRNKSNDQEFNKIIRIVKDLMCLKNKADKPQAQAPAATEEGEQCLKVTGNIDEKQKKELLNTIYNLFKKLIESKKCLDTIFEISVTMDMRRESKPRKYTLDEDVNKNLLMDLKKLFEYFKENKINDKYMDNKFEEISNTGVKFEQSRLGKVIIGNNIKTYNSTLYTEGNDMLFINPISTRKK